MTNSTKRKINFNIDGSDEQINDLNAPEEIPDHFNTPEEILLNFDVPEIIALFNDIVYAEQNIRIINILP